MRILHVSTRLILGGSQENTVLSCEGQARLGHDVHLAYGPIYGPEGSMLPRVEAFNAAGGAQISTHLVPDMVRAIHPLRDWKCRRQLKRLIESIRPDVVHTHSSKAGILGRAAAWSCFRASGDRRPAVVHTIHGPPFHPFQNRLVHALYVRSERWAARRCHVIAAVAEAMTRQYLQQRIGEPSQYTTVYSGMEIDFYLNAAPGEDRAAVRSALGVGDERFIVGTVARLAELKGHDDLLDALGAALKESPRMKLLWVGDGWLRADLLRRCAALGLRVAELDAKRGDADSAHVILTGLVPPSRIPGLMRAMDVLAHPSYREGLPRTVPQALLAGTCPVAYDCDGAGEACIEMQTGRLVKTGDRAALREAVLYLRDQPESRRAMAERGRELCRVRFSAATMVSELEQVYAKAIALAQRG